MREQHDLELILGSHFPIVTIESHEEQRTIDLIKKVVANNGKSLHTWTTTEGLQYKRGAGQVSPFYVDGLSLQDRSAHENSTTDPVEMLRMIKKGIRDAVLILLDFHPYLDDPVIVRLLKEIALDQYVSENTIVLLSHRIEIPNEIKKLCASFELSLPDSNKLKQLVIDEAKLWSTKNKGLKAKTDRKTMDRFVQNLMGLTESDARRLIRNAIYDDGAITECDLPEVMAAKYELISQDGVLTFEYDTAALSDVGGFQSLKDWLNIRKAHFLKHATTVNLDVPKGILLVGIQGSGKSLAAKAVAGMWGVPLLRLDFGRLYNKYFGETEKNIRDSLKAAEVMAPCVLWMDEIEKGIATGDYDSGTSRRVLGTLLTWMAENKSSVFVVATANDIQSLPPELVRKGRFDELFFVDLPTYETRQEILSVHLRKRDLAPSSYDLVTIAQQCDGFSGAEIEQAVVAALYSAHAEKRTLESKDILEEVTNTKPLSVVMEENISGLRRWASGRTVAAN